MVNEALTTYSSTPLFLELPTNLIPPEMGRRKREETNNKKRGPMARAVALRERGKPYFFDFSKASSNVRKPISGD